MSPPITPHFHCRMGMFAKTRPFFPKNFLSYSNFYFFQNLKKILIHGQKKCKTWSMGPNYLEITFAFDTTRISKRTLIGSLDVFGRKGSELSTKKITLKLLTQKLYRINVYVPQNFLKIKKENTIYIRDHSEIT